MKSKKKIIRNSEKPIQKYRFFIQVAFAALCIWIGIQFYLFAHYLESGGKAQFFSRPPGVEGFLPISSMMSLYFFIRTGIIHPTHPAGMFIFLAIVLISLVFGKAFCSWLCPIGFISELIGDFGEKIFRKKLILPKWIDYPLRSLKYILLGLLFYAVFVMMSLDAVKMFLDSPYNQVADLKMYYFFANISSTALIVLIVLFLLSIFIRNFWCRFLCPYGAFLGLISFFSPHKIKRNPVTCIDCGLCAKACPSSIKVDKVITVISDECSTCMNCVDVCPVADTLNLRPIYTKKKISKKTVAIGVVSLFMLVTGFAMVTGHWQNNITKEQYLVHFKLMDTYGHPTGTAAIKKLDEKSSQLTKEQITNKKEDGNKIVSMNRSGIKK